MCRAACGRCQADGFLQEEQRARDQQPLPEVGPMQDEQEPHGGGRTGGSSRTPVGDGGVKVSGMGVETKPRFTVTFKARTVPRALAIHTYPRTGLCERWG